MECGARAVETSGAERMLVWQSLVRVLGATVSLIGGPNAVAAPIEDQPSTDQEAAEGLVSSPIAGPFEFPWSVGFLPEA